MLVPLSTDFVLPDLNIRKVIKTQNMILKNILGVHSKSSNTAVKCELGIVSLSIKCYGLMYGYYSWLNQIDEQLGGHRRPRSLLKAAYEVDKQLTFKENSWTNNVIQYSKAMIISSLEISKDLSYYINPWNTKGIINKNMGSFINPKLLISNFLRERPFNLKGGYGFFLKKIFWFPVLLNKIFWCWWRKKK